MFNYLLVSILFLKNFFKFFIFSSKFNYLTLRWCFFFKKFFYLKNLINLNFVESSFFFINYSNLTQHKKGTLKVFINIFKKNSSIKNFLFFFNCYKNFFFLNNFMSFFFETSRTKLFFNFLWFIESNICLAKWGTIFRKTIILNKINFSNYTNHNFDFCSIQENSGKIDRKLIRYNREKFIFEYFDISNLILEFRSNTKTFLIDLYTNKILTNLFFKTSTILLTFYTKLFLLKLNFVKKQLLTKKKKIKKKITLLLLSYLFNYFYISFFKINFFVVSWLSILNYFYLTSIYFFDFFVFLNCFKLNFCFNNNLIFLTNLKIFNNFFVLFYSILQDFEINYFSNLFFINNKNLIFMFNNLNTNSFFLDFQKKVGNNSIFSVKNISFESQKYEDMYNITQLSFFTDCSFADDFIDELDIFNDVSAWYYSLIFPEESIFEKYSLKQIFFENAHFMQKDYDTTMLKKNIKNIKKKYSWFLYKTYKNYWTNNIFSFFKLFSLPVTTDLSLLKQYIYTFEYKLKFFFYFNDKFNFVRKVWFFNSIREFLSIEEKLFLFYNFKNNYTDECEFELLKDDLQMIFFSNFNINSKNKNFFFLKNTHNINFFNKKFFNINKFFDFNYTYFFVDSFESKVEKKKFKNFLKLMIIQRKSERKRSFVKVPEIPHEWEVLENYLFLERRCKRNTSLLFNFSFFFSFFLKFSYIEFFNFYFLSFNFYFLSFNFCFKFSWKLFQKLTIFLLK